jgi:hypothetical protein
MAKTSSHTQGQIYLTVLALRKLRAGEPIDPKSCTREHFGDYLTLVEDMRTSLVKAMAGAEDQAAITNAMDAYWSAVRLDTRYRDIVDTVDTLDVEEAVRNGQPGGETTSNEPHQHPPPFQPYSLADLQKEDIPERHWVIDGRISEGVHVIAGPSGGGKSYWAFQLCLGVAHGTQVFSKFDVEQGEALYLALEDDKLGMKERAEWLEEDGAAWPQDLYVIHEARRLDMGLVDDLRGWLQDHPKTRLIVIDVLFNIRVPTRSKDDLYAQDYAVVQALKPLAKQYHIAIILLHHCNKRPKPDDPLDAVSGSTGLIAPADIKGVFMRASGEADWTLYLRGRPIPEQRLAFTFRECVWTYLGEAQAVERSSTQKAILKALEASGGPMTPKKISEQAGIRGDLVRFTLRRMVQDGTVKQPTRGWYALPIHTHSQHSQHTHTSQHSHIHNGVSPQIQDTPGCESGCESVSHCESDHSQFNPGQTKDEMPIMSVVSDISPPPTHTHIAQDREPYAGAAFPDNLDNLNEEGDSEDTDPDDPLVIDTDALVMRHREPLPRRELIARNTRLWSH